MMDTIPVLTATQPSPRSSAVMNTSTQRCGDFRRPVGLLSCRSPNVQKLTRVDTGLRP